MASARHMSGKNYQDLNAWKRAMDLVETVYRESAAVPAEERYGLTDVTVDAIADLLDLDVQGLVRG